MSGIVAVISRDPDVMGRGPAMLARLRHLPQYQIATLAVDGAWLGVCGWPAGIAGDVLVASEAKAFLCDPRFQPRLDELTCATLLALETMIDALALTMAVSLKTRRDARRAGGQLS